MDTRTRHAPRRLLAATGAAALLVTSGAAFAPASFASSHREAPLISGDPRADNTDTYAFVSPDNPNTVTLIANWYPFEEPNGGPNFYSFATNARYNIKIDNNGDGKPDVTYTWIFTDHYRNAAGAFLYNTGVVKNLTDKTLNYYQSYDLTVTRGNVTKTLLKNKIVAPSDVGKASMPNYGTLRNQAITEGTWARGKTYVGQADDPFFLDLRVFDLLYGANLSEAGHDTLDGYNVQTIALQVKKSDIVLDGNASRNPVIGVWSTTDRRATTSYSASGVKSSGAWVQVSRLGNPLVNEAVVPLKYKDAFNGLPPALDHTVTPVVNAVKDPIVPKLIQAIYGIKAPPTPRNDLVEIFLTGICKACGPIKANLNSQLLNKDVSAKSFIPAEELRLNTSIAPTKNPNRLGVIGGDLQGFPNGRRLTDDVIDIVLQAAEGAAQSGKIVQPLAKGDGVNANDVPFAAKFPYIALPHTTSVNAAPPNSNSSSPNSGAVAASDNNSGNGFTADPAPYTAALLTAAAAALGMAVVTTRRRRRATVHV